MANEATKVEAFGENSAGRVMQYTVSSSAAIPLGSVMVLSASPRTMAINSAQGQKFVGVTNAEKEAADDSTSLGVFTDVIMDFATTGTVNDGDIMITSATANTLMASNAVTDPTIIVGMALNDASANRTVVRVNK